MQCVQSCTGVVCIYVDLTVAFATPWPTVCHVRLQDLACGENFGTQPPFLKRCSGRCVLHRCHAFMLSPTRFPPDSGDKDTPHRIASTRLHMFSFAPPSLSHVFLCLHTVFPRLSGMCSPLNTFLQSTQLVRPPAHRTTHVCKLCTRLTCTWRHGYLSALYVACVS